MAVTIGNLNSRITTTTGLTNLGRPITYAEADANLNTIITAFGLAAPISSPTFTGTVSIPTLTLTNALAVVNGGTGTTTSTGTGSVVLSNSPTFAGTVSIPTLTLSNALAVGNGGTGTTTSTGTGSVVLSNSPTLTGSVTCDGGITLSNTNMNANALYNIKINYNNESSIPITSNVCAANTNGSSTWSVKTTPSGSRTSDRSVDRLKVDENGNVLVISKAGLGYGTNTGGTVTQLTNKQTPVVLDAPTGQIILHTASLVANTTIQFQFFNTYINANDVLILNLNQSAISNGGASGSAYNVWVAGVSDGGALITIKNITAAVRGEAIYINFAVIKGSVN